MAWGIAGCAASLLVVSSASAVAKPKRPRPVTLEWVGDIALSTQRGLPPGGLERALAPVRRSCAMPT